MSHPHRSFILAAALIIGASQAALASPFCTQVKGGIRECTYADAEQCDKRAAELGGICIANPAELRSTIGSAHYCLVDSDHASSCVYVDRATCEVDAFREGGAACLDNPAAN